MSELPVNEFIEKRGTGYYLVGSRVSLDTIAGCLLRKGYTVDDILDGFPSLERAEVERVIGYIRANQAAVDAYVEEGERRFAELARQNPLPPAVAEKIRKARIEKGLKSA
jgi:uncharacterized protein (DUF433 family)